MIPNPTSRLSAALFDRNDIWDFLRKLPLLSKVYSSKLDSVEETSDVQVHQSI